MTDTNKINLLKDLEKLENLDKIKSPAEKAYKVNYGGYPITDENAGEYDKLAWNAFYKGFIAGQFYNE
jgi:hypothetical protein